MTDALVRIVLFAELSLGSIALTSLLDETYTILAGIRQARLQKTLRVLDIVVQEKLIRMRPQTHRVHFLATLVSDPGLDQILTEYPAFQ